MYPGSAVGCTDEVSMIALHLKVVDGYAFKMMFPTYRLDYKRWATTGYHLHARLELSHRHLPRWCEEGVLRCPPQTLYHFTCFAVRKFQVNDLMDGMLKGARDLLELYLSRLRIATGDHILLLDLLDGLRRRCLRPQARCHHAPRC